MSVSLALLLTAGVLIACGVYLVLERTLTRVILGFVLLGNGVNLLFIVAAGPPGKPPFEGTADPGEMTDPLPFAMVLTAIVISLGITAFGMALAYRAWQLFGHDEVPDDVEDRRVLRRRRRRSEDAEKLPWSQALSEESRRGALMHSQGFAPADDDQLGSDLTSAEDVPQDATEADEGQEPAPRPAFRRRARDQGRERDQDRGHDQGRERSRDRGDDRGATRAPGAGPATDHDPDPEPDPGPDSGPATDPDLEHTDERGDA